MPAGSLLGKGPLPLLSGCLATLLQHLLSTSRVILTRRALAALATFVCLMRLLRSRSPKGCRNLASGTPEGNGAASSPSKDWRGKNVGSAGAGGGDWAGTRSGRSRGSGWGSGSAKSAWKWSGQDNGHGRSGQCQLCRERLSERWWLPLIRVPTRGSGGSANVMASTWYCHLPCVATAVQTPGGLNSASSSSGGLAIEPGFEQEFRDLLAETPQLGYRKPSFRRCHEEVRLAEAAATAVTSSWFSAPIPAPPKALFLIEGLSEIRLQGVSELRTLPPDIGFCHGLRGLVLISCSLCEIPAEIAQLDKLEHIFLNGNMLTSIPGAVAAMGSLTQMCLDANIIDYLPPLASTHLKLFTAAGNRLCSMPSLSGKLERIELHGNELPSLSPSLPALGEANWNALLSLKVMGNRLRELPVELSLMGNLRTLMVASNRLEVLPSTITDLKSLEWIIAYNNIIASLPSGLLLGSRWLERVLLEDNPLSAASVASLLAEASRSRVKTLGMDTAQVRVHKEGVAGGKALPQCVSLGSMVPVDSGTDGPGFFAKLVRASQLRPALDEPSVADRWSCPGPEDSPADVLVVALAASQGEPEWLGLLRRVATSEDGRRRVSALAPVEGTLTELHSAGFDPVVGPALASPGEASAICLARLWSSCTPAATPEVAEVGKPTDEHVPGVPLHDFDILCVVDHRMRWYSEDPPAHALQKALTSVCTRYHKVLFVGASMGGCGALLHGASLADAILTFGPQARLYESTLRPPVDDPAELRSLSGRVVEAARVARGRGALVEVHCAADEHLLHALVLPLADLALTVHPLCPRKPFARLLDRAGLLLPIVEDMLSRLLLRHPGLVAPAPGPSDGHASRDPSTTSCASALEAVAELPVTDGAAAVACWGRGGRILRRSAGRAELLQIFFHPDAPQLPRPGDWFCPRCSRRNQSAYFFCNVCGPGNISGAHRADAAAVIVPGGQDFGRPGDWGCGHCGMALSASQQACTHCRTLKGDDARNFVVA